MEENQEVKSLESMNDTEKWYLLSSVANLYYNSDLTQNQIAERFYTSRSKISRMLKEARELGIVEIKIREPWENNQILEKKLVELFPIRHARVISVRERNLSLVLQKLGEAAAYYLDSVVNSDTILGVSWGNTVYHTVRSIKTTKNLPLTVVPIMGGIGVNNPQRDSLDFSKELADAYGGKYHYIYAPLFVKTKTLRDSLIQEDNIREVLEIARSANVVLTSVGSMVYKTWKDYVSTDTLMKLEKKGAVGHIGGHFFDRNGREIPSELTDRLIGIGMEDFRKAEEVICVAGMEEKAEAMLGVLQSGCVTTLITDEFAAGKVLEMYLENR